ncbi:MAG: hypothetical protein PWR03_1904, partial [Tenuifilum sp.]|nr:hypothetical protein [Tenuifilum sp.]
GSVASDLLVYFVLTNPLKKQRWVDWWAVTEKPGIFPMSR